MQTFEQHLADLAGEGKITLEEANLVASEPDELERSTLVE